MAGRPNELFDAGLQLERTHLAWNRTAVALLINALLVARFSRHVDPHVLGSGLAAAFAVTSAAAWWYGRNAYASRSDALTTGRPLVGPCTLVLARMVTILAFVTVALTAAAFSP